MVFPAACSSLGRLLAGATANFQRPSVDRAANAAALVQAVSANLDGLLEETAQCLASLSAAKAATRYETLRRLNVARGHLHDITDRAVPLDELARIAGVSRFQLLRDFRSCFGAPPAAYHRRLRLGLAKQAIDKGWMTCAQAARDFGFADGSSFTHAYTRTHGAAPVRTLRRKPA